MQKLEKNIIKIYKKLIEMHYKSGACHLGGNLSSLDILHILWDEVLSDEDRFVLSKGHSAGALYICLWNKGIISDQQLLSFHQDNTLLPGHPPINIFKEIPFATGSLGHGLSLAAGMSKYKKLTNKKGRVYCLTSDGEWQEGSTWEALVFIAHHSLDNLTVIIDNNNLQGFGDIKEVASMSNLKDKIRGFNVDILEINGHNYDSLRNALEYQSNKVKIIIATTTKGNKISFMENKLDWHYLKLNKVNYEQSLNELDK